MNAHVSLALLALSVVLALSACASTRPSSADTDVADANSSPRHTVTRGEYRAEWKVSCRGDDAYSFCNFRDAAERDDGSIVVVGEIWGKVELQGVAIEGRRMPVAIVAEIRPDGALAWMKTYGRSWHNRFEHVALANDGKIHVAGVGANGFHPEFEDLPDPETIGASERGFVGTLSATGEWEHIRVWTGGVADLVAAGDAFHVVSRLGRTATLSATLDTLRESDLHLRAPTSSGTPLGASSPGTLRLLPTGEVWRVHDVRREDHHELVASLYRDGVRVARSPVLGRLLSSSSPKVAVDPSGNLVVATIAPRHHENYKERVVQWWVVTPEGNVRWRAQQAFKPFDSTTVTAALEDLTVADGRIATLIKHGDTEEVHDMVSNAAANAPNDYPMATVRLIHDLETGIALRVDLADDACLSASITSTYEYRGHQAGTAVAVAHSGGCDNAATSLVKLSAP